MKKILIVVFVFIASYSQAQDVKFGLKGGLNLSTAVGDDVGDVNMKAGLYFGGFLNAPLSKSVSFQPELLYSSQGWKENDVATVQLSYLNIPLLLKMNLGGSDKVSFYAGPQLGFILKSEAQVESDNGDVKASRNIDDNIAGFDFSLNLGLSFVISNNMALDIRYNRGLSKLIEFEGVKAKAYNSTIQLGAAYSF